MITLIARKIASLFLKGCTSISFQKLLEHVKKHNFLFNVHNVPRLCIRQESFLEQVPTDHSRPHDRNHLRAEREGQISKLTSGHHKYSYRIWLSL